jgi:pimeloyl-ACP methyl ester carboxylesterase
MLAWLVLAASVPAIVCVLCAAFLAHQQRPAWITLVGLSIGAQIAAVLLVLALRGYY